MYSLISLQLRKDIGATTLNPGKCSSIWMSHIGEVKHFCHSSLQGDSSLEVRIPQHLIPSTPLIQEKNSTSGEYKSQWEVKNEGAQVVMRYENIYRQRAKHDTALQPANRKCPQTYPKTERHPLVSALSHMIKPVVSNSIVDPRCQWFHISHCTTKRHKAYTHAPTSHF